MSGSPPPVPGGLSGYSTNQTTPPYNYSYPQLLHRTDGGRMSQYQFPTTQFHVNQSQMQGCPSPDTNLNNTGFNTNSTGMNFRQHRRNCSFSSTHSSGGVTPSLLFQRQPNFDINSSIQSHRRTSSVPNQTLFVSNPNFSPPSQPIPIPTGVFPSSTQSPVLSGVQGSGQYQTGYGTNFEMLYSNSANGSYGNLTRPDSRIGSPLEDIRGCRFCFDVAEEVPPVWCMDCQENLVVLGTGAGRLEIWDSFSGYLKVFDLFGLVRWRKED